MWNVWEQNQTVSKRCNLLITENPNPPSVNANAVLNLIRDGEGPHHYLEPKDRYRHIYYEAQEVVAGEVEQRFDQTDLHMILSYFYRVQLMESDSRFRRLFLHTWRVMLIRLI